MANVSVQAHICSMQVTELIMVLKDSGQREEDLTSPS